MLEQVSALLNTFLTLNHQQQTQIDGLAARIESIQDIAQIISQFAGQSRLLTFNAQIEAARAGQYGRGFRVIANEIGQLSDLIQRKAIDNVNMIRTYANDAYAWSDHVTRSIDQLTQAIDDGPSN